MRLRQISLGDEVDLSLVCPNQSCRAENQLAVNLTDLPVTPYGPEREFVFTLPASGTAVTFVHLTGQMEKRLASLKEANISSAMLMRIVEVGGKVPSKKTLAEMPMRDRVALRREMLRVDGGIDTTIDLECPGLRDADQDPTGVRPRFFYSPKLACERRLLPGVWRAALGLRRSGPAAASDPATVCRSPGAAAGI